jgi:hypothetical protein
LVAEKSLQCIPTPLDIKSALVYGYWEILFTWAPRGSEEEDVDACEDNQAHASGFATFVDASDDGDDKLADKHTDGAIDEEHASTEPLDGPEG